MRIKYIALAIAATSAMAAGSVRAATTTTDSINPPSASDNTTNGTYSTGGFSSGTSNIGDFTANRYNGPLVLTGATFTATLANEPVSFTRSGTGTTSPTASAYASGQLSVAGITATANSATINSSTTIGAGGVNGTIPSYAVAGNATTQAQLNNLYGSGTVAGTVAEALYISKTGGSSGYSVSVNNTSNRTAAVEYTYQTVNHANGSFSGSSDVNAVTLDFGTIMAGTTPAALAFNLYNAVGSWALQYVTGNYSGDGLFSLSGVGSSITNLAAGSFVGGAVNMAATLTPGAYTGTWTFFLADSATGIAAGRNFSNTDTLTLTVKGQVAAVPEPGEWAMILAGLGLIGLMAGRKRRSR